MPMASVTIRIDDDRKTIQVPWRSDMNVQEALETAYDQEKAAGRKFSFAVQYFGAYKGEYLGYLVVMIDEIYDNPKDTNDYWLFKVNGNPAPVGIDSWMVNGGDLIEFEYLPTLPEHSLGTQHEVKKTFYAKN